MRRLFRKMKAFFLRLFRRLRDVTNLVIFAVCFAVLSSEVWVPYLLALVTQNPWFFAVGSACWAFWLAPGTPFLVICFGMTFAVRGVYDLIRGRRRRRLSPPPPEDLPPPPENG